MSIYAAELSALQQSEVMAVKQNQLMNNGMNAVDACDVNHFTQLISTSVAAASSDAAIIEQYKKAYSKEKKDAEKARILYAIGECYHNAFCLIAHIAQKFGGFILVCQFQQMALISSCT